MQLFEYDGEWMNDMQARAKSSNYNFYYALDEQAKLAEAFVATRTPNISLLNSDMELVFTGGIDDNAKSAEDVDQQFLKNAIRNLVAGKEINPPNDQGFGMYY